MAKTKTSTTKRSGTAKPRRTTPRTTARKAAKAAPKKAVEAPPKKAAKAAPKKAATPAGEPPSKADGRAPVPPAALAYADKLDRIDSLFVRESGSESYAIFGARGPILWGKGLALGKADLALWREVIEGPEAHDGKTWRFKQGDEEYTYTFSSTENVDVPGHVVAMSEDEAPEGEDGEDHAGPLCFAGARYGELFMVFAGSPNDFADGDFHSIHDVLRACGAAA